jgi:hypothetical protein
MLNILHWIFLDENTSLFDFGAHDPRLFLLQMSHLGIFFYNVFLLKFQTMKCLGD